MLCRQREPPGFFSDRKELCKLLIGKAQGKENQAGKGSEGKTEGKNGRQKGRSEYLSRATAGR